MHWLDLFYKRYLILELARVGNRDLDNASKKSIIFLTLQRTVLF